MSHPFNDHSMNERLGALVKAWTEKIRFARERKKEFDDVAYQCRAFFNNAHKFWTDERVRNKWIPDQAIKPKFQMSMCKAFELVALYGPLLYWQNPQRQVRPRQGIDLVPELFPDPNQFAMWQQQEQSRRRVDAVRSRIEERVLNYLPVEQPGGGLRAHARRAVVDALVTGRGCLWTQFYQPPGSDVRLCGSFYESVDTLLIDPDCKAPDLSDAYWIVREVIEPTWVIERKYNLPAGSVEGNLESTESLTEIPEHLRAQAKNDRKTHDLARYYMVFSKCGIGYRFQKGAGADQQFWADELFTGLDEAVGDYAYLAICPGMKYPLNLPGERLAGTATVPAMTTEQVQQALRWPVEFWRDGDWPVTVLDFYEDIGSPWPIAPLKPGLGELVFLNVFISALSERIWNSSRDFLAYDDRNKKIIEDALAQPNSPIRIALTGVNGSVADVIQFLQQPQTNFDAWRIIDRVTEIFERRTGLHDLFYGMATTADRSAEATATRKEQMQLRPDDMSSQVEAWQTRVAVKERIAAKTYVRGNDVRQMLGDTGAWLWDTLVVPQPLDVALRGSDVTIEAGSSRKPNKARDIENLQQVVPVLMPLLTQFAQATGEFSQVNELLRLIFESIDMDGSGLFLAKPQPDPAQQQQMQADQAAQQQAAQMEQQAKAADVQAKQVESQLRIQRAQLEHALRMQQMNAEAQAKQQDAQVDAQKAQVRMAEMASEAEFKQMEMQQRLASLLAEAQIRRQQQEQSMQMQQPMGGQAL